MGFYTSLIFLYGCPIASDNQKVVDKINKMSVDEKIDKDIMAIGIDRNYFKTRGGVFLITPSVMKTFDADIEQQDILNGYVKMSELENVGKIKREDFVPSAEELATFTKYINVLVKEEKKEEMESKIGYYVVKVAYDTYGWETSLVKYLPVNMEL